MSDGTDGQNAWSTTTRLPDIRAEVREDGTGEISVDGVIERVRMANLAEAGAAITSRIAELAGTVGRPVPVQVRDPDGVWSLLIHADGLVDEAPGALEDQPGASVDSTDASPGSGPIATVGGADEGAPTSGATPEVSSDAAGQAATGRSGAESAPTPAVGSAATAASGAARRPDSVSSTPSAGTPATS